MLFVPYACLFLIIVIYVYGLFKYKNIFSVIKQNKSLFIKFIFVKSLHIKNENSYFVA